MYIELDDFRQSYVVARNEILKSIRGKKFTLCAVLIALVFALITFFPYVLGGDLGNTPGEVIANYITVMNIPYILIILVAALFASVTIVSEFEERTALILFTRPVKKTSIFLGKVLGCIMFETFMIALFYLGIAVVSLLVAGSLSVGFFVSLGISFLYIVAASGVAIFISSIMKKGSTSVILTFIFLFMILMIISSVIGTSGADPWFMLDQASDAIGTCMPEYVDYVNEFLQHLAEMTGTPPEDLGVIEGADIPKTIITMVAWSIVSFVLAWMAFIRREF